MVLRQKKKKKKGVGSNIHKSEAISFQAAVHAYNKSDFQQAVRFSRLALDEGPENPDAMHLHAASLLETGSSTEAEVWARKAIRGAPRNPEYYFTLGNILQRLERLPEAMESYGAAIKLKPDHWAAQYNIGNIYLGLKEFAGAIQFLSETTRLNPGSSGAWHNLGVALAGSGRLEEAVRFFRTAVKLDPGSAESHNSMGVAIKDLGRMEAAGDCFAKAINLNPEYAVSWMNLGNVKAALSMPEDAEKCFSRALSLQPAFAEVHYSLGNLYQEIGEPAKALVAYETALTLKRDYPEAAAQLFYQARQVCDWPLAGKWEGAIDADTGRCIDMGQRPAEMPFINLIREMDSGRNLAVAEAWSHECARRASSAGVSLSPSVKNPSGRPITLGYLSGDFRNHPVGLLVAGMLSCHDRSRFRVHGYAYGPGDTGEARRKIAGGCDLFVDLGKSSTIESARRIYEDGVDILVDLTGHTRGNRIDICAFRPAPVQVSYLGFIGSSGAEFIDYILTDRIAIPPDQADAYSEKFVYLPNSFMVSDNRQEISGKHFSKSDFELPEEAFVFCSFNNSYKIDPAVFGCWMRILKQVPESVLWLFAKNSLTVENLKREVARLNVSPERLVFANRVPLEEHLARLRLADLALDTWCYNGGATTINALWAGVPVISLVGKHFVSRMTAGALFAAGLKELVAETPSDYERLAIRLATHPEELSSFRARLKKNRRTEPLFDTLRFTRDVESAYEVMWERFTSGEPPAEIVVEGPDHNADAAFNLGVLYHQSGDLEGASSWYERAVTLQPGHSNAHTNLGAVFQFLGDAEKAADCYEKALAADPSNPDTYHNMGTLFLRQGMHPDAVICFRKVISLRPADATTYYHLGNALKASGSLPEAAAAFQEAVRLRPDYPDALNNFGTTLQDMGEIENAVAFYRSAIKCNPDYINAYYNLGTAHEEQKELSKAVDCYKRTLELNPDHSDACGRLVHLLRHLCDWDNLEVLQLKLSSMTEVSLAAGSRPSETPFMSFTMFPDPGKNLTVCRAWSEFAKKNAYIGGRPFSDYPRRTGKRKITIGYLSNSFRNHPGAHLILGLFAAHDRRRFQVNCYSYGPNDGSEYRKRIKQDCDNFYDIEKLNTSESAKKIHKDEVDILVDLRGHTYNNRIGICALRPAPLQVNFLGFPCTTGADYIDYMIVDRIVAPADHAPFYTEKLVYMPHCYQVNDNTQAISETVFSRKDAGLPLDAVVFASFNTSYKFEPGLFDCWMRILGRVPGSVLWLLGDNTEMEKNLKRAAGQRGADPCRIVFAKKMRKAEHLSRLKLADIVLDTQVCNGHTSTSDALWAGVPVVVLLGTHFASRVSASILNALGMPELVVPTAEAYEEMAVRLAGHPELLTEIRNKVLKNRNNTPLFDTPRFVENLETAYQTMWERCLSGEKPKSFFVEEDTGGKHIS